MGQETYVVRQGGDADLADLTVDTLTIGGAAILATSILLGSGEVADINGEADALVLDADADTTISAPTDDQIDIELNSVDHVVLKGVAGIDAGVTRNIMEIAFTSPADTTGTNVHNALNIDVEVGNASGGTNAVNAIAIDNITGDAQVTETAISIGTGWANGVFSPDSVLAVFGTGSDVTMGWDGTDFDVLAAADNSVINFGTGTNSFDVKVFGETASDFVLWDASESNLEVTGDARLDFTGATVLAANTDGGIIKAGTAIAPVTEDTADLNFISLYFDNGATSGDNRGIYNRLYLTGAGGGGESLRSFTTISDIAAGTAHGAHISLSFGATGSVTGQGIASRNTLHIPDAAMSGGTVAALQAEIFADGSSSDISGTTAHALFRGVISGDGTGAATVANFLDLSSVPAAGDGAFINTNATVIAAGAYAALRVLTPAGLKYLHLYDVS